MIILVKPDYVSPSFVTALDRFIEINEFSGTDNSRLVNLKPGQEIKILMLYGSFTVSSL